MFSEEWMSSAGGWAVLVLVACIGWAWSVQFSAHPNVYSAPLIGASYSCAQPCRFQTADRVSSLRCTQSLDLPAYGVSAAFLA